VEVATNPPLPVATHSETDAHEMLSSPTGTLCCVAFQSEAPPAGFVVVSTALDGTPTATHSELEGHDSRVIPCPLGRLDTLHEDAPPAGFVESSTRS
jgi:hypothetical protein